MKNHYETTIDQWPTSWLLSWRCWYDDMTFISTRFTIWGLLIVVNKFKSKGTRNKIIELNIIDLSGTISSIGKLNIDKLMPKLMDELYFSLWSDLSKSRHFILARNLRNLCLSCGHGEALLHKLVIVETLAGFWKYLTSSINCSTARRTRSWSNSLMTFHYKRNSEKSLLVSLNYGNTSEQPMQFQHRQPKEVLIAGAAQLCN